MGLDDETIADMVQRILRAARPVRIILFGSAAQGTMTTDSDVDLLIVEEEAVDRAAENHRIRAALRGAGHPFDVFVMPREEWEETKDVFGGIAYPANKYGKVIYENPG